MKAIQRKILAISLFSVFAMPIGAASTQSTASSNTAYTRIDELLIEGIAANLAPGAVVLVGQGSETTYLKAHGLRSVVPNPESMTTDTVFDIASLTKVVATTTAIMILVEQGKVRLNEPVSTYIPGFEINNKDKITVRHLLTHVSGLRPSIDLHPWSGYDAAIALAIAEVPTNAPEEIFVYSDIGFFLLADIVKRVSGETLDVYTKRVIFEPLGMKDTGFFPTPSMMSRMAPTERCAEQDVWPCKRPEVLPLRGVLHDPTGRRMGGVAGHAGVFSTAKDLQRFATMLVNGGQLNGVRILAPATVKRMITPITLPANAGLRGLGWDIDTRFSSNRGDIFPIGSYGHTGFTGTSLWIDQTAQTYVVFLSSRLHPDGVGNVIKLRGRIATVAAAALSIPVAKGKSTKK